MTNCRRETTTLGLACLALTCTLRATEPSQDFHAAAESGDIARISTWIADHPELLNRRDRQGRTPLLAAVSAGQVEIVRILLEHGADLSRRDANGANAVMLATLHGGRLPKARPVRQGMLTLLLEAGADPLAADRLGQTSIHAAASRGHTDALKLLVRTKSDANVEDHAGRTPLHAATAGNHTAVIESLAQMGADVLRADKSGNAPLHMAAMRFRAEAAGRLLTLNAEVDQRNRHGRTPLHLITVGGPTVPEVDHLLTRVARVLLEGGADINARDEDGNTPLRLATERGHSRLMQLLLEKGGTR